MQRLVKYSVEAIIPNRETLRDYIKGRSPQKDGTILLFRPDTERYEIWYDPKEGKILLYLTGETKGELVEDKIKFFRYTDRFL
jgi:hypothetical protein